MATFYSLSQKELNILFGGRVRSKDLSAAIEAAREDLEAAKEFGIEVITCSSPNFPFRLNECPDAPMVLYSRGTYRTNPRRNLAIVGTRMNSSYGADVVREIVKGLKPYNVQVISGLANGIDSIAHRECLENGLETVAVLAHGLDVVYPTSNRGLAEVILESKGGLVTEYAVSTIPDRMKFPARNRIVAGMVDAVLVVESAAKGGSLITAELGLDYGREVMAVPGKAGSRVSSGTNGLIKRHVASLIESAEDIANILGWQKSGDQLSFVQPQVDNISLSGDKKRIYEFLARRGSSHTDELSSELGISTDELSLIFLELELEGLLESLPGNQYAVKA